MHRKLKEKKRKSREKWNEPRENQSPSQASEPWRLVCAFHTNQDTQEGTWGKGVGEMELKKKKKRKVGEWE